MIEVKNLRSGYGRKQVLTGLNARFPKGKVTALLGPNGCGKTTLLKALCGILPASGQVLLNGKDLLRLLPSQRARQVAYLSQSRPIPDLTVEQLVLCGRYPHQGLFHATNSEDEAVVQNALARMGISDLRSAQVSHLSGGQRQKAYLAMALAQDAEVLLLDEPTTYLDIRHQLQLLRLTRELTSEGKTVIAVLHDLQSALQTADHILLMDSGIAVTEGTPEAVFESGRLQQVFGVSASCLTAEGQTHYCFGEA